MQAPTAEVEVHASSAKKRIPKACSACRTSKVRCDEQRPCTRCRGMNKTCVYFERPKSAEEQKIEDLELVIQSLKQQLQGQTSRIR